MNDTQTSGASTPTSAARALEGVRVLDFTQVMAGPFCTMLLGDLGADVIKIESPDGDPTRKMAGSSGMESPGYAAVNRNKRGMILDLKNDRAKDVVRTLVNDADVLVENYRPGVMAALGLSYNALSELNPALIYASISGYGQTGPYAGKGGFDLVAQGMSGLMSVTGLPNSAPVKCGIPITDLGAGLFTLQAILAAYIHRQRTGEGQHIDASLLEAGVALSIWEATEHFSTGRIPEPLGSAHRMFAPYQAIRCADGHITLGAANQRGWERFADAIGRSDLLQLPQFRDNAGRLSKTAELIAEIEAVTVTQPREYWLAKLDSAGIPAGPILNYQEVFNDPQVRARDMVQKLEHPEFGAMRTLGPAVKLSKTPAVLSRPAPCYGEQTEELLSELGYEDDAIRDLVACGAAIMGPDHAER